MRGMAGYTNIFWIGGNLLLDLGTGSMSQVLMLVYKEEDASTFTEQAATQYLSLFKVRAERAAKIRWSIEGSKSRRELFVIRGEQDV